MTKFEYDTALASSVLADRKLGDELDNRITSIGVKSSHKGKLGNFTYELGHDLSVRLELFNSDEDKDTSHRILGKISKKSGAENVDWKPLIELGKDDAWLKYTTSARVGAGVRLPPGPLLGASANREVVHFYYHRHRRTELLGTAVARDMAAQKIVFAEADVRGLGAGEVLGFAAAGHLRLALKIAWADVLAAGASRLAGLVEASEAIMIRVSASAVANIQLELEDDFKLVFLGLGDGWFRVALRKSKTSSSRGGATTGIRAGLSHPSDVNQVLNEVMAGLLGTSLEDYKITLQSLREHADLKSLPTAQREIAKLMLERTGLGGAITRSKQLLSTLAELEKKASAKIRSVAASKVELGFSYEYSRVEDDASILEADITAPALRNLYRDLLAGQFEVLLRASEKRPEQIRLRRFLQQERLHIEQAIGLSLGISRWSVSGKENTTFRFVTQANAKGAARYALLASRKYSGNWLRNSWSTLVEFKADMKEFKPGGAASLDDFILGLSLNLTEAPARTGKAHIRDMVDTALLWGAGPEGDRDRLARGLMSAIPGNSATQSTALLTMSHAEVREYCRWMAKCTVGEIAEAFAAAMPCWENYPQTLEIQYRRRIYRKIWERWILDPFAEAATASAYAYSVLRKYNTSLANEERKARRSGTNIGHTIYRTFSLNRDMLKDFRRTRNAFSRLDTAIDTRESHEKLIPIARDIHRFANTRFKIRVLGALITTFRRSQSVADSNITATLNVRYKREKGKFREVYVISHRANET